MKLTDFRGRISRFLEAVIQVLVWVGSGALALMVLVVVCNVVGRFSFKRPLLGAVEMVGLLTVVVVFCVLAFTESQRAHISVDIIPSRLPRRAREILAGFMCLLGAGFFIVMGWQGWELMLSNLSPTVVTSGVLSVPLAPFMFIMALGCVLFGLELFMHAFNALESVQRKKKD